jgi:hypothetical protein
MNEEYKPAMQEDSGLAAVAELEPRPTAAEPQPSGVRAGVGPAFTVGSVSFAGTATAPVTAELNPLFSTDETKSFRSRWDTVQGGFVDEPRQAVEQANVLVAEAMKRLAEIFAAERTRLDGQWDRGDDVSTEDLRLALQRYRSFFGRLLSV